MMDLIFYITLAPTGEGVTGRGITVLDNVKTISNDKAAELLDMHPHRLYRLAREGKVPHIRLGRSVRYRVSALLEWMEEQEKEALKDA